MSEPAFPVAAETYYTGITMRDYFAAAALPAFAAQYSGVDQDAAFPGIAGQAYALADAMLAAREGKRKDKTQ